MGVKLWRFDGLEGYPNCPALFSRQSYEIYIDFDAKSYSAGLGVIIHELTHATAAVLGRKIDRWHEELTAYGAQFILANSVHPETIPIDIALHGHKELWRLRRTTPLEPFPTAWPMPEILAATKLLQYLYRSVQADKRAREHWQKCASSADPVTHLVAMVERAPEANIAAMRR